MLRSLHIENYALISRLDTDFYEGFSVVTGETGAGKSIMLGAIGLLKGQRADVRTIKDGELRCMVEAVFDVKGYQLESFFAEHDLDFDGNECVVRREITASGKSRAFINDTPVTAALLKNLGDCLLDVHSQHQNLLLSGEDFQLGVLDTVASTDAQKKAYQDCYHQWQSAMQSYRQALEEAKRNREDEDYWRFQLNQLEEALLGDENEQICLEQEQEMLEHSEEIRESLNLAKNLIDGLDGDDMTVDTLSQLKRAKTYLTSVSDKYGASQALADRLDSCLIELKDIADELETHLDQVESNPERLEQVNDRLNLLYTLERKHHVDALPPLIDIRNELSKKINAIDHDEEWLEHLKQTADELYAQAQEQAVLLTNQRRAAVQVIETTMVERLQQLGMPHAHFQIDMQSDTQKLRSSGCDTVTFLFSANKNGALQEVAKVASGGEIARVMLSLKSLMADTMALPTIIFDEIDTGVSGKIAEQMAQLMSGMGKNGHQVISITHLPQIAAAGNHHYKVFKDEQSDTTVSNIVELTESQRVDEIAHMLSGSQLTPEAVANAKSLLNS